MARLKELKGWQMESSMVVTKYYVESTHLSFVDVGMTVRCEDHPNGWGKVKKVWDGWFEFEPIAMSDGERNISVIIEMQLPESQRCIDVRYSGAEWAEKEAHREKLSASCCHIFNVVKEKENG